MGDRSSIEWTQASWNPIAGCTRVSAGCMRCYAERQAFRAGAMGIPQYEGLTKKVGREIRWTGEVRLVGSALELPRKWKKPRRIFVNSMSDLFHEKVPDEWIGWIFEVMETAKQHTYQILTKRPERMLAFVTKYAAPGGPLGPWPWQQVWLGVSVEDQATADARIPVLLQTPAAVRWCSYEPALGPVDFSRINGRTSTRVHDSGSMDVLRGIAVYPTSHPEYDEQGYPMEPLDWVVIGGESGPSARPFDLAWARQTIAQGRAAGVPVFCKQMGSNPVIYDGGRNPLPKLWLADRKGGAMEEWPADLRVREYPHANP